MRRIVLLTSFLLLLFALPGWAQTLQTYRDLALRINLSDQLRVIDQSGYEVSGTVTQLTREALTLRAANGDVRLPLTSIRSVSLVGHAIRRGAAIGAVFLAGLNLLTKARNGDAGGGAVGAAGATIVGAGLGTAIGALSPQTIATWAAPSGGLTAGPRTTDANFFDTLALRVNLDDTLQVETEPGPRLDGHLVGLTDDGLTLRTDAGNRTITRASIRRVALSQQSIRTAALIGGAAGALAGVALGCSGSDKSECVDGALLLGGLSAGVGAVVGAMVQRSTTVYPASTVTTSVTPMIQTSRGGMGVHVQMRW